MQNLFDNKDEIANRIQGFIDDSVVNGEGLLIHSLKGYNRACCVVLIYLLKRYI
jgi:protein-tyrosine phosphatase